MSTSGKASLLLVSISLLVSPLVANASNYSPSIPSVVVTIKNSAPSRGALQTPVWIGIHDGTFDIYDLNVALGAAGLVAAPAVERLAEDGNTGPISTEFSFSHPYSPQTTLIGPSGPLTPGDRSSTTLNVDPEKDRYFSYASMVIPSNDAFIANGNPLAHKLFDDHGRFVGKNFAVPGSEVLDAGTEFNDEEAGNTAFLNQGGPDIGIIENGVVLLHPGFLAPDFSYPNGVLNHPVFGMANFLAPNYRAATVKFRYVDLGQKTKFNSTLRPNQEVTASLIDSRGRGSARAVAKRGEVVNLKVKFRRLSGPATAAHLHLGAKGTNGPVVVTLTGDISNRRIRSTIQGSDVMGPLAGGGNPMLNLLNELAAGNVYINIHTAANPGGEIRGQVRLEH